MGFIILLNKRDTPADLEVIKLDYSLSLKIKRNDWLIVDTKQPIIALYFES